MRREDKIMLFTFIIVCSLITLGVVAIRQKTVESVTQEQKQEETIEVAEETVEPSVVDVEVKPTTEDVKVEDKQEVVKQEVVKPKKKEVVKPKEVTKPKKEEKKTKLEKAEEVAISTMAQGYEGNYTVSIDDIGIATTLYVEEFTEVEQLNAIDVDQAINKALRVNKCKVPTVVHITNEKNEWCHSVVDGVLIN